jgi:ubiquinol-cytochrome c reductase iron-sulfur subunit
MIDFAIDLRPAKIQDSYRFEIESLPVDEASLLRRDNLSILVIRRSPETVADLRKTDAGLQDPQSRRSDQPPYAANALRSKQPEFFVSYALGTDFGCALEAVGSELKEICGSARYDFAGRALAGDRQFPNLVVPDYNFSDDFRYLTIRP